VSSTSSDPEQSENVAGSAASGLFRVEVTTTTCQAADEPSLHHSRNRALTGGFHQASNPLGMKIMMSTIPAAQAII
jgi:hypothetical protein